MLSWFEELFHIGKIFAALDVRALKVRHDNFYFFCFPVFTVSILLLIYLSTVSTSEKADCTMAWGLKQVSVQSS